MKNYFILCLTAICTTFLTCTSRLENMSNQKLLKVTITDSICRSIIHDYIKHFPFEGKGVYLVNIKNVDDTVKLYVGMAFTKESLNNMLRNNPYYFYDYINNRVIIVDTQLEKYFKPQCIEYEQDTILDRYYEYYHDGVVDRNVYLLEYKIINNTIDKQVVRFNPF